MMKGIIKTLQGYKIKLPNGYISYVTTISEVRGVLENGTVCE